MTSIATIEYRPATVRVSDDRGTVAGAAVTVTLADGRVVTGEIIPQEGPSRDAWIGMELDDLLGEVAAADEWLAEQLGWALRDAATCTRAGHVTIDDETGIEGDDVDLLRHVIGASGLSARQWALTIALRDERTVRRWLAGDSPIPEPVLAYLRAQLNSAGA